MKSHCDHHHLLYLAACPPLGLHTPRTTFDTLFHSLACIMSGEEEYLLVAPPGDGVSDLAFSPSPSNLLLVSSWDSVRPSIRKYI